MIATMHKLLVAVYSVAKTCRPFGLQRCQNLPPIRDHPASFIAGSGNSIRSRTQRLASIMTLLVIQLIT